MLGYETESRVGVSSDLILASKVSPAKRGVGSTLVHSQVVFESIGLVSTAYTFMVCPMI